MRMTSHLTQHWRHVIEAPMSLLCVLVFMASMVAGCASGATHPTTPTATPQPSVLPSFTDWRAAYLGADGHIHAVSLDGKSDLAGALLPNLTSPDLSVDSSTAPNGKLLIYQGNLFTVLDLTRPLPETPGIRHLLSPPGLLWSPDSTRVALEPEPFTANSSNEPLAYLTIATHEVTVVPLEPGEQHVLGGKPVAWLDNTHWIIEGGQGATIYPPPTPGGSSYGDTVTICSLDVTNGAVHVIAAIRNQGIGAGFTVVSPDKRTAFFYNIPDTQNPGQPYTPLAARIDLTTGEVTYLPTIGQSFGTQLYSFAWRPGTMQLAATTQDGVTKLYDLQQDTITPLALPSTEMGLSVGGWWPGRNDTLLMVGPGADGFPNFTAGADGSGPYTLAALTLDANNQTSGRILTQGAMTFLSLGFVRTA